MGDNNVSMDYEFMLEECKLKIQNIKLAGIDTNKDEQELSLLENKFKTLNSSFNASGFSQGAVQVVYSGMFQNDIKQLQELLNRIRKLDFYANVIIFHQNIGINSDKNDLSLEKLQIYVSDMIRSLNDIQKQKDSFYGEERYVIKRMCEIAYNIIKLELVMTGESQLYLFIQQESTLLPYFSNSVLADIERINLNDQNNQAFLDKKIELSRNGNYFDLDLIKMILAREDRDGRLKSIIAANINELGNEIALSNQRIKELYAISGRIDTDVQETKKDAVKNMSQLKNRFISFLISFGIFFSMGTYNSITSTNDKFLSENDGDSLESIIKNRSKEYYTDLAIVYIFYIIMVLAMEFAVNGIFSIFGAEFSYIYGDTKKLIVALKQSNKSKKDYESEIIRLDKNVNMLMMAINDNKQLRERFNQLYEENKFLLDNAEELYRRIDSLTNLDEITEAKKFAIRSKKLSREYKERRKQI